MVETTSVDLDVLAQRLQIPVASVHAAVELLDDGNTVPFITRYRKDQTGGLDEEQIRAVEEHLSRARALAERKRKIHKMIEARGKLTPELERRIEQATQLKEVESIYLPFKTKKQTLAALARERGLEPLAQRLLDADPSLDFDQAATELVNGEEGRTSVEQIRAGVGHLLAERFSERIDLREKLRKIIWDAAILHADKCDEPSNQGDALGGSDEAKLASASSEEGVNGATKGDTDSEQSHATSPATSTLSNDRSTGQSQTAKSSPDESPIGVAVSEQADNASATEVSPAEPVESRSDSPAESSEPQSEVADATAADVATAGPVAGEAIESESPTLATPPAASDGKSAEEAPTDVTPPTESGSGDTSTEEVAAPSSPDQATGGSRSGSVPGDAPAASETRRAMRAERKRSKREAKQRKRERLVQSFKDYFDYSEPLRKIQPHRVLAINRGERCRVLRVAIASIPDRTRHVAEEVLIAADHPMVIS